jgi:hypothetical protein
VNTVGIVPGFQAVNCEGVNELRTAVNTVGIVPGFQAVNCEGVNELRTAAYTEVSFRTLEAFVVSLMRATCPTVT